MEIIFENVSLSFPGKTIFSSLNINLSPGKIIQVVGENGSGKSTFLNLAAHLIRPTSGKVMAFCGKKELNGEAYRKKIAMLSPNMQLYDNLTAKENLKFFSKLRGESLDCNEIAKLWERVGLREENVRHKYAGKLSTGMSQRVKFAVFLAAKADVWILDEPSANLDDKGRSMIIKETKRAAQNGALALWATNDERERNAADEIIDLSNVDRVL